MGFLRKSFVKCILVEDRVEFLFLLLLHGSVTLDKLTWSLFFISWKPLVFNMCSVCISPHVCFALDP